MWKESISPVEKKKRNECVKRCNKVSRKGKENMKIKPSTYIVSLKLLDNLIEGKVPVVSLSLQCLMN